jgi:hypothetical protein
MNIVKQQTSDKKLAKLMAARAAINGFNQTGFGMIAEPGVALATVPVATEVVGNSVMNNVLVGASIGVGLVAAIAATNVATTMAEMALEGAANFVKKMKSTEK